MLNQLDTYATTATMFLEVDTCWPSFFCLLEWSLGRSARLYSQADNLSLHSGIAQSPPSSSDLVSALASASYFPSSYSSEEHGLYG